MNKDTHRTAYQEIKTRRWWRLRSTTKHNWERAHDSSSGDKSDDNVSTSKAQHTRLRMNGEEKNEAVNSKGKQNKNIAKQGFRLRANSGLFELRKSHFVEWKMWTHIKRISKKNKNCHFFSKNKQHERRIESVSAPTCPNVRLLVHDTKHYRSKYDA